MYSYVFDTKTRGYLLTTQTGKYVASEIRPVFAFELLLTGLEHYFEYDHCETRPMMWGIKNTYVIADIDEKGEPYGRKVAQLNNTQYGKPLNIQTFFEGKMKKECLALDVFYVQNPLGDICGSHKERIRKL